MSLNLYACNKAGHFFPSIIKPLNQFALVLLFLSLAFGGKLGSAEIQTEILFQADTFTALNSGQVQGWEQWSQRLETRPQFFAAEFPNLGGPGSLGISGASNSSSHGCWLKSIPGIAPGGYYRLEAFFRTWGVPYPRQQVFARLDWLDAVDERAGPPEYVPDAEAAGDWQKVAGTFQAPAKAASVEIELYLSYCPQGTVWWDKISLSRVAEPAKRMVRVATVNCRPGDKTTPLQSVEEFCELIDQAGSQRCDIICLGESISIVGLYYSGVVEMNRVFSEFAEAIPGPSTEMLARFARKHGMYVVAALVERENQALYNTAVLIDRQGKIAGKYRKVQLPYSEIEKGITPGESLPVFETDFGKIGVMICWDTQYPEPARALAAQGAEIIFVPAWSATRVLAEARAVENQVYAVYSCYSGETISTIFDPWGKILAEAPERPSFVYTDIDLSRQFIKGNLGNMRNRLQRERRADLIVPALER